ncbi:MAG: LD-carboxypeptidase [Pseudomonadota bacterium]
MSSSDKISRRSFGALAAAAVMLPAQAHRAPRPMKSKLIKPPRLHPGDLVGLIAPGGVASEKYIERAVANIEKLGFRCKPGANLRAVHGKYAGSVQQRVADVHAMFADPEVKAIWCIRGGSGCISILSSLDYKMIRAHPKVLLGYSDITALHLALFRHAGLVTFHGPVAISGESAYARTHMLNVLMDPQPSYTIPMAPENALKSVEAPHFAVRTVNHGQVEGRLIGGNLSLVSALMGTPYAADFRKRILFLEEVNEEPYRIDRWMTQLDLAVGFKHAAGVMVGICDNCGPVEGEPSLTLDETLDLHLKPLVQPAVTGYSFGHIRHQFTMPVGVRARLDTLRQSVTLLEAGVT